MEIYVRLNDDLERDYAFQISKDDSINTKIKKIFATKDNKTTAKIDNEEINTNFTLSDLMVLRPSIFHNFQPVEYYKSNHQGYLTEGGCLLFHYDGADKDQLVKLDSNKPLFDQIWPGQLIVPKWELNMKYYGLFIFTMLAWLYTDLPDSISPTPGICLTNQLSRLLIPVLENWLQNYEMAAKLRAEIQVNYSSLLSQWIFFALHCAKIIVIFVFCKFGMVNPLTINPFKLYRLRNIELTRKTNEMKAVLKSIGWIGTKRATYDDYQSNYYNYMTKKFGGTVPLYKSGLLKIAANPGVPLNPGEGFQTPLDERFTNSTFKEMETTGKFVLSEDYFIELEDNLKEKLDNLNGDIGLMNEEVKRFRRYGLYEPSEKIKNLVAKRRAVFVEEEKIKEETNDKKQTITEKKEN